jgi:hypothetical protein
MRGWAEKVTKDAQKGIQKRVEHSPPTTQSIQEDITSSERQKLKALIRELNTSRKKDE